MLAMHSGKMYMPRKTKLTLIQSKVLKASLVATLYYICLTVVHCSRSTATVEGIGLVRDRGVFLTYSVNIPCGMETGWPAENPRLSW